MPGTVPFADGRPNEQEQLPIIRLLYIETHTHIYMLHIYVYMKVKIRKKRYFVVYGKTLYLQWVVFLEETF